MITELVNVTELKLGDHIHGQEIVGLINRGIWYEVVCDSPTGEDVYQFHPGDKVETTRVKS